MVVTTHILRPKKTSMNFARETFFLMKGGMLMFSFLFVVLLLIYLGFDTVMTNIADGIKFIARLLKKKD